ncbi:MAG: hypothetical protein H6581_06050 [Bacteroidia bacterium]|nr:hypothetical protein [Bacteroidia bacterium]
MVKFTFFLLAFLCLLVSLADAQNVGNMGTEAESPHQTRQNSRPAAPKSTAVKPAFSPTRLKGGRFRAMPVPAPRNWAQSWGWGLLIGGVVALILLIIAAILLPPLGELLAYFFATMIVGAILGGILLLLIDRGWRNRPRHRSWFGRRGGSSPPEKRPDDRANRYAKIIMISTAVMILYVLIRAFLHLPIGPLTIALLIAVMVALVAFSILLMFMENKPRPNWLYY